jgi:N-acetylmuramoyl-L-alanine amidase
MIAVRDLCRGILGRWPEIEARNVVGHSDIAPDRKQDPGELFPWAWLAAAGVGVWTDETAAAGDLMDDLAVIGYDTELRAYVVVRAFQRHFLPGHLTGEADAQTAGKAAALRALVDAGG